MTMNPDATVTPMTATPIDWRAYLQGPPVPGIHYHGYLWTGRGSLLESYKTQDQRAPGKSEFDTSDLPAEATRHNLLRRRLLKGTWASPEEAAAWMRAQWDLQTPTVTHHEPGNTELYHEVTLSHQKDTTWSWWFPGPGSGTKVHVCVVCCPNEFPDVPCPYPPN